MDGDATNCFGPLPGIAAEMICLPEPPTSTLVISDLIQTTECASIGARPMTVGVASFCVFAAREIRVTDHVFVRGERPVLLLATESISIAAGAALDASSYRTGDRAGAGGRESFCGARGSAAAATGGGAGGTNQGRGGTGGGAMPGVGAALPRPMTLEGGCAGGDGGTDGTSIARGGRGGGAMYLSAPTIDVQGALLAAGEGGAAAEAIASAVNLGGGGGGAGGYIGLHGTDVTIDPVARIVAAGGGGGGARGGSDSTADPGETATEIDPVADGGSVTGSTLGGSGGTGSDPLDGMPGNSAPSQSGGGGGGGGGAGYIDIRAGIMSIECVPPQCVPASVD